MRPATVNLLAVARLLSAITCLAVDSSGVAQITQTSKGYLFRAKLIPGRVLEYRIRGVVLEKDSSFTMFRTVKLVTRFVDHGVARVEYSQSGLDIPVPILRLFNTGSSSNGLDSLAFTKPLRAQIYTQTTLNVFKREEKPGWMMNLLVPQPPAQRDPIFDLEPPVSIVFPTDPVERGWSVGGFASIIGLFVSGTFRIDPSHSALYGAGSTRLDFDVEAKQPLSLSPGGGFSRGTLVPMNGTGEVILNNTDGSLECCSMVVKCGPDGAMQLVVTVDKIGDRMLPRRAPKPRH